MESTDTRASQRYARTSRRIDVFAGALDLGFHVGIRQTTRHHEIDRTTQERGQFATQRKEGLERRSTLRGVELDHEVGVRPVRIEVHAARARTKHVEPPHVMSAAQLDNRRSLPLDHPVHVYVLKT